MSMLNVAIGNIANLKSLSQEIIEVLAAADQPMTCAEIMPKIISCPDRETLSREIFNLSQAKRIKKVADVAPPAGVPRQSVAAYALASQETAEEPEILQWQNGAHSNAERVRLWLKAHGSGSAREISTGCRFPKMMNVPAIMADLVQSGFAKKEGERGSYVFSVAGEQVSPPGAKPTGQPEKTATRPSLNGLRERILHELARLEPDCGMPLAVLAKAVAAHEVDVAAECSKLVAGRRLTRVALPNTGTLCYALVNGNPKPTPGATPADQAQVSEKTALKPQPAQPPSAPAGSPTEVPAAAIAPTTAAAGVRVSLSEVDELNAPMFWLACDGQLVVESDERTFGIARADVRRLALLLGVPGATEAA